MPAPTDPEMERRRRRMRRLAHRVATAGVVLWWLFAFFSTGFFAGLTAGGLAVYLLGLPVCYALLYYAVKGAWWAAESAMRGSGDGDG